MGLKRTTSGWCETGHHGRCCYVLQDENQQIIPGLATAWRRIDDTTWEVELRKGAGDAVQHTDGVDGVLVAAESPEALALARGREEAGEGLDPGAVTAATMIGVVISTFGVATLLVRIFIPKLTRRFGEPRSRDLSATEPAADRASLRRSISWESRTAARGPRTDGSCSSGSRSRSGWPASYARSEPR